MKAIFRKFLPFVIIAALAVAGYTIYNASLDKGFGDSFAGSNGRIEATEIDVSSKLPGRIQDIFVDEGDFVQEGQLLAVMQTDSLEAQLGEARAQVAQAKAAEASARAQVVVKMSDISAAKAIVQQRESELDQNPPSSFPVVRVV